MTLITSPSLSAAGAWAATSWGSGSRARAGRSRAAACDENRDVATRFCADHAHRAPPRKPGGREATGGQPEQEESGVAASARGSRRTRRPVAEVVDETELDSEDPQELATRLLERALRLGQDKDDADWLHSSAVKSQLMKRMDPSFSEKALGYRSFSDFVKSREAVAELDEANPVRPRHSSNPAVTAQEQRTVEVGQPADEDQSRLFAAGHWSLGWRRWPCAGRSAIWCSRWSPSEA